MAGIKGKSGGARTNSGGAQLGAGRKQGTKNLRTIVAIEAARLLARTDDPKQ